MGRCFKRFFNRAMLAMGLLGLASCTAVEADPDAEPMPIYETVRPEITQWMKQPAILVFSKTAGWRHNEGIAGADKFFVELARERGYGIFTTVNGAVFNAEDLARFEVIVFNNMTGDTLNADQEVAFQTWLEAGGAWIGLHGAGDSSHGDWAWYATDLIGPTFVGHPQTPHFNEVRVETLAAEHPVMAGVPAQWRHNDEWYFFDSHPKAYGLLPLAGIYETDFEPEGVDVAKLTAWAMGDTPADHPIIWVGCPGEGRSFYSAIGHSDLAYDDPTNRKLLNNAFDWVSAKADPESAGCPEAN